MKFIFPILSILVCGVAAYFSLAESKKFTEVQDLRLETINTNKSVTASADAKEVEVRDLEATLGESKDSLELAKQSLLATNSNYEALEGEERKVDTRLADQQVEFDELKKSLVAVQEIFSGMGGGVTMDNLGEKVAEVAATVKEKQEKVETLEGLIEDAKKDLTKKRDSLQRLADRKSSRSARIAQNSKTARVSAVNQDWGFLVIGAGSNSGYSPQTELLITRGGKMIGRVTPSGVEPTQTIAEIDMDSLAPGVRIQPGDRVMVAKPSAGN